MTQDHDAIGDLGDESEIVRHIDRRHPVTAHEIAHDRQNLDLRRDVERGRRLVEDDEVGRQATSPWRSSRAAAGRPRPDVGSAAEPLGLGQLQLAVERDGLLSRLLSR